MSVGYIFFAGSKKQMFGIAASGIVAMVTNEKIGRYFSFMQFVRESMKQNIFAINLENGVQWPRNNRMRPVIGFPAASFLVGS